MYCISRLFVFPFPPSLPPFRGNPTFPPSRLPLPPSDLPHFPPFFLPLISERPRPSPETPLAVVARPSPSILQSTPPSIPSPSPRGEQRSIENRLAMMQMAMTTRLILQMIKSLAVGEQASSDAIGEQSRSDVDGDDHETGFAED
ncbi:hypothetical protein Taro_032105 [Colocasia esculenta]|uniref:Uncharacterized protein n=1 Tax=Colocasia esculenta TaxID=4460 RepID=A0A843VKI3_COLES|nr:hypothetical protein [Colocasia esculenta]